MLKKIGIIREEKQPIDTRTPLIPSDCRDLMSRYPGLEIFIQPCSHRCFTNQDYTDAGVVISENMLDCDLLLGVKEVPIEYLIPNKRYMFFSHTIKRQAHNQKLLQAMLDLDIEMIDYEALTDSDGNRLIAFGYWAGIVGTYNAIWTLQNRFNKVNLPRLYQTPGYISQRSQLKSLDYGKLKFVITGTGRVGSGAKQVMEDAGIEQVSKEDFLTKEYDHAVYTQLGSLDYFQPKFSHVPNTRESLHTKPMNFKTAFLPYTKVADIFINCIYWDPKSPKLFTLKDMKTNDFHIKVIADITADIAPDAAVPSTIKATTIDQPVFGFLPLRERQVPPFTKNAIDVMSIANLPSEVPIDASTTFSERLRDVILPEFEKPESDIIRRGTICKNGRLTPEFLYLESYVYDDEYRARKMG